MVSVKSFFLFLGVICTLIVTITFARPARAEEICSQTNSLLEKPNLSQASCAAECEAYYLTNPDARPPAHMPSACQENALQYAYQTVSPLSCLKGAWEGVLSFPEMIRAYALMAENLGESVRKNAEQHRAFITQCDRDPACRREIARGLSQYSAKTSKGEWLVPDSALDAQLGSIDMVSLLMKVENNKAGFRRSCEAELVQINSALRRQGLESDEFARGRYDSLAKSNPACVGALKMDPPVPTKERPSAKWLQKLGIKLQCYSPQQMTELVCYEIASWVVDPASLVGGGLALKAIRKAGLFERSVKGAAKLVDEQTLKLIYVPRAQHIELAVGDKAYNMNNFVNFPLLKRFDAAPKGKIKELDNYLAVIKLSGDHTAAVFHLRATPAEVAQVKKYLADRPNGLSTPHHCVSGACKVLRDNGIINVVAPLNLTAASTSAQLSAMKSLGSRRIKSIEIIGSKKDFWDDTKLGGVQDFAALTTVTTSGAAVTTAATAGVYTGINYLITYEDKKGKVRSALVPLIEK